MKNKHDQQIERVSIESLTPPREKFAQAVASGMNQSDAYREAFKVRAGTKLSSINVNASKLMADAKVAHANQG